jgi:methylated-DNA-[protein]-cysteine S-methyltransferase
MRRRMTAFQARVLGCACGIPRGETRTYAQVAMEIGCPKAARAVGNALARNPFPVRIPCHRVVGSGGRIGGYSGRGGAAGKKRLLIGEGAWPAASGKPRAHEARR